MENIAEMQHLPWSSPRKALDASSHFQAAALSSEGRGTTRRQNKRAPSTLVESKKDTERVGQAHRSQPVCSTLTHHLGQLPLPLPQKPEAAGVNTWHSAV